MGNGGKRETGGDEGINSVPERKSLETHRKRESIENTAGKGKGKLLPLLGVHTSPKAGIYRLSYYQLNKGELLQDSVETNV